MSAATLPSAPRPGAPARDAGRVAAIIVGALLSLIAAALLVAGGLGLWAQTTQRDADGWFSSPWHRFETPTRALTAEGLRLGDIRGGPEHWIPDVGPVRVRARAADGGPVFVAIAPESRVDSYLRGVAHSEVEELRSLGYRGTTRDGTVAPQAPAVVPWTVSSTGRGTQTVSWNPESGSWAIVVMNADGSPSVNADVQLGARARWLLPVSAALLASGLALAAAAVALIAFGAGGAPRPPVPVAPPSATEPAPYPVTVSTSR